MNRTYLTEIHDNALMDLLPQVSPEDLNEGDLQRWDLAVHEDSCQVKLHLETHIHLEIKTYKLSHYRQSLVFLHNKDSVRCFFSSLVPGCTYIGSVDGG